MSREGFILPVVLLLMVALTGLATVALVVARNEVLLESGDFRYLGQRLPWVGIMGGIGSGAEPGSGSGSWRLESADDARWVALGGGFALLRTGAEGRPGFTSVVWYLDPLAVEAGLPSGAEVGWGGPTSGVRVGEGDCPGGAEEPLVRTRPPDPAAPPNPPLDPPPRLGPLGIPSLLARARPLPESGGGLGPIPGPGTYHLPPGARIRSGEGAGTLLVPGDLTLAGSSGWIGLVLVQGDLTLEEDAFVEGVALVGGRLRILGGASLAACPSRAGEALSDPALSPPFPLRGGRLLGRF